VPALAHLTPELERRRYSLHHNSLEDEGYVRFLMPAVDCLKRRLPRNATVLDYGAGPSPVLVELLKREGFQAAGYDPFFMPEADLSAPFEAVVSTETFEHFRRPCTELDRIVGLIRPGGLLVVMTALCTPERDFTTWHYVSDDTHIAFYSEDTFRFIADAWGLCGVETDGRQLVALTRA
jgi:hypothetical protein